MDLDDEELKVTRMMNGADRNSRVRVNNDIEVNEYVRTKKGAVGKLIEIDKKATAYYLDCLKCVSLKNIVKHSKQLIDLIEAGDYVNGHLVEEVRISCFDSLIFVHEYEIELREKDIKTILTKEQFEANCYKVGGEE